ncbi:MAG: hypothetical protein ACREX4_25215 [Gammaproteobacteria bacterium]
MHGPVAQGKVASGEAFDQNSQEAIRAALDDGHSPPPVSSFARGRRKNAPPNAWNVNFSDGNVNNDDKNKANHVRAVRGGS